MANIIGHSDFAPAGNILSVAGDFPTDFCRIQAFRKILQDLSRKLLYYQQLLDQRFLKTHENHAVQHLLIVNLLIGIS